MNTQLPETRNLDVQVPARIQLMQDAKINSLSFEQMIDPLTNSEVIRLEEKLIGFEKIIARATSFIEEFESYKEVVRNLSIELGTIHKTGIFKGKLQKDPILVVSAVASTFGVTVKQIMSKTRVQHIAFSRMIAMYILRETIGFTLQMIGEFFGKDHGTVLHACKQVKKMLNSDNDKKILGLGRKAFRSKVKTIQSQFEERK